MSDGLQIFEPPEAVDAAPVEDRPRRRPRWPGALAGGIAILMVISWAAGLAFTIGEPFELGVGLTISAILLSVLAVVAGIIAVVGNWGRGWGAAAIAVGVLLNPVVVLLVLSWMGTL